MIRRFDWFLTFGVLVLSVCAANAQDYAVMPINESFDIEKIKASPEAGGDAKKAASLLRTKISKQQSNASTVFRTGDINTQFQKYYNEVVVPELTRYDRESLADLTNKHQKLIKDLNTRVRMPEVRGYLIRQVYFPKLSGIVEGNYHPACRYNALLTIGKLDEVVGKQRVSAPRAYSEVLPYLIKKYNEFTDPKLAYLKYGAFKGIARVAGIEFQKPTSTSANPAKPILSAMLGAKPAGLDDELFLSMQKTAVQTLGLSGDPVYADSYVILIQNKKASVWTRAEAAIAFSKIKAATYDAAKLESVADSIGQLMHDVLREEVKSLSDQQLRIAVLAARKKEVGLEPTGPALGPAGSSGSMNDNRGGNRDNELMAGGGSAPGGGGGAAPGSGGAAPGSGGAGKKGGRSGRARADKAELEELPDYRITLARRRIKTIALGMVSVFGETAGTTGIMRWGNTNQALLPKLSKLKEHMAEADAAAEVGLATDGAVVDSITDAIRAEFTGVADKIAQTLGVSAPAKGGPANPGKKKAKAKSGDAFLNN